MVEGKVEETPKANLPRQKERRLNKKVIALFETALIVLGLLGILFLLPHINNGDGSIRYHALAEMLTQGKMPTMMYSMVGPFFSIPFWYLGKIYQTSYWWISRYNTFVFAAGLLVIYLLLKDRVERSLLRKFFLLLIVASMFSYHLQFYYGEVFTAIFVGIGCIAIVAGPELAGWCVIILGVVNTPATLLGLVLLDAKHMLETRRFRYALTVIVAGALTMLESWIRRGSPFNSGYAGLHGFRTIMPYSGRPGFSNPFFFGLISLLFSFGKGIFWFAPGLLLPIRKTLHVVRDAMNVNLFAIYTLWISFLIGLLLVYSTWWAWHGGWFWGPRFLLTASIPASFALAVRLQWRETSLLVNIFTILVFCLSLWVGINGAIYGDKALVHLCLSNNAYLETPLCYYTPEFSVLWYPFVVHQSLNHKQMLYLFYSLFVGVYLFMPLLITTGRQLSAEAWKFGHERLSPRLWRI